MLLEAYYALVGAGVVGVVAQHYLPKLKDVKLPTFTFPKLSVPKIDFNAIRATKKTTVLPMATGNSIRDIIQRYQQAENRPYPPKAQTAPPPSFRGVRGNVHMIPPTDPIAERINHQFPFAQAVIMEAPLDYNTHMASVNVCWFNSKGERTMMQVPLPPTWQLHPPVFLHTDNDQIYNMVCDAIRRDEMRIIDERNKQLAIIDERNKQLSKAAMPKPNVAKQSFPEYMNVVMKQKINEIELKKSKGMQGQ